VPTAAFTSATISAARLTMGVSPAASGLGGAARILRRRGGQRAEPAEALLHTTPKRGMASALGVDDVDEIPLALV
jgi:hypothetical protein